MGVSRWDARKNGNGKAYNLILNENFSNIRDSIIADTAVTNGLTLITNDKDLLNKMKNGNFNAISFDKILSQILILSVCKI